METTVSSQNDAFTDLAERNASLRRACAELKRDLQRLEAELTYPLSQRLNALDLSTLSPQAGVGRPEALLIEHFELTDELSRARDELEHIEDTLIELLDRLSR